MKINEYEFSGSGWLFDRVVFQNLNLIVGDSGAGKTRLLNTIFNLGTSVAQGRLTADSEWNVVIEIKDIIARWSIISTRESGNPIIKQEKLSINDVEILKRDEDSFIFHGEQIPKLFRNQLSVYLLRDEPEIKPIYEGFSKILRRRFFRDEQEKNTAIFPLNQRMAEEIGKKKDLYELYKSDLPLNPRLYILKHHFPEIFELICQTFLETFDYVREADIFLDTSLDLLSVPDNTPFFCIKENNVEKLLRIDELSSGMQKALIIITDYFTLPPDSIYLIDEYENSLGIGSIDFLPNLIEQYKSNAQVFITSHHPYIISKIPVRNWYVTYRQGSHVSFDYGDELEARYSISGQDKYFQLINDKKYSAGIE